MMYLVVRLDTVGLTSLCILLHNLIAGLLLRDQERPKIKVQ